MISLLVSGTSVSIVFIFDKLVFTFVTTTSLSTTLLSLLEAAGTIINLSIPILSTSVFKVTKSDFAISTSCSF